MDPELETRALMTWSERYGRVGTTAPSETETEYARDASKLEAETQTRIEYLAIRQSCYSFLEPALRFASDKAHLLRCRPSEDGEGTLDITCILPD